MKQRVYVVDSDTILDNGKDYGKENNDVMDIADVENQNDNIPPQEQEQDKNNIQIDSSNIVKDNNNDNANAGNARPQATKFRSSVFQRLQYVRSVADEHKILKKLKWLHWKTFIYSCILLISFFCIGVVVYTIGDEMTIFNAIYFCSMTFLTVGYGDFTPSHNYTKIFTCFFIFTGLGIVSTAIKYVAEYLMNEHELKNKANIKQIFLAKLKVTQYDDTYDDYNDLDHGKTNSILYLFTRILSYTGLKKRTISTIHHSLYSISLIVGYVCIGIILYTSIVENMTVIDAMYFSCVTITSVGYGDITPTTQLSKAITIIYAICGTVITAKSLSSFHLYLLDLSRNNKYKALLGRNLDIKSLQQMDTDGDQIVTRGEYILHKVVEMGLIDEEMLAAASRRFDELDIDKSGTLTMEDIEQNDYYKNDYIETKVSLLHQTRSTK
jgi:potassium channel subfamily K